MMALVIRFLASWQTWAVLVAVAAFVAHVTIVSDLRDQIREAQATADGLRIQVIEQNAAIGQMRADADRRAARAAERAIRELHRPAPMPPPKTVSDLNAWMQNYDRN